MDQLSASELSALELSVADDAEQAEAPLAEAPLTAPPAWASEAAAWTPRGHLTAAQASNVINRPPFNSFWGADGFRARQGRGGA